ncbi:pyridoxal phosphate-dependent decarboxylase family protein [Neobacillus massiliamazoniensis]|uniref:2,4-diaminobutyrate decarboxylase n=1 Tax=Neobacillus massiliamazoniensis TaxID=1499688 RepID=A0A0U1NQA1_9BACI|nr:pyridoxal-dependent decarboxylase [Neobacillus massiliamazoniensis]CRK80214.1 2,4-diaminobutyrate decarboxylase [Neobacillus massiliamazoniensis]
MLEIQKLFPSVNGDSLKREEFLSYIRDLLTKIDELKDENKLSLGEMPNYNKDFYNQKVVTSTVPQQGIGIEEIITSLVNLAKGQRIVNSCYVANAAPLPNTASIIGNLLMTLLNGNNIWDIEGSAAASAEVEIVSSLSKIVGYDEMISSGYTTWGGQGAVFNSLRIAIAKKYPNANRDGVPNNLYAFCSELSHFSLYKSMEATGIGTSHLIRVKVNEDDSMNLEDLHNKMVEVIENGGVPIYVLATMGTTDSFGIDDIKEIKNILKQLEVNYHLEDIYLHADTAMGGMFTFFNDYNFHENPLGFEEEVLEVLMDYHTKFKYVSLSDSMVFDFHKLGQTPYTTSLFLIKDKLNLKYVDLDAEETPYIGDRGFGSYHTSYTLECSRMGSSIPIYASLLTFGVEGYQKILANYLRVNIAFRKALKESFPDVVITNEVSPVTTFRFYEKENNWPNELFGRISSKEIIATNEYNENISDNIGNNRNIVYFGSTKKQKLVFASDSNEAIPLFVHKFYCISPYTTVEKVPDYINFLKVFKNKTLQYS